MTEEDYTYWQEKLSEVFPDGTPVFRFIDDPVWRKQNLSQYIGKTVIVSFREEK